MTGYTEDSIWGYTVNLFFINKSDKEVMFSVNDASVNGYMADPFFAKAVMAGKCAFASMSWSDSTLEENSIAEIEEINILNAAMLAMKRAVLGLEMNPELVLVDGNKTPELLCPVQSVVKGDAVSASIAAASILSKVARDRYMLEEAEKYPEYGFEKHKGYGTKLHREKILEIGECPIHRLSFLKKIYEKK